MQLFLKEPATVVWDAGTAPPVEREPYLPEKPSLVYIICFDAAQSESNRYLTKMLVSSLLRTFFTGDIVVFRNSPQPLFFVERKGLEEVYVETEQLSGKAGAEDAWCWKYKVAELLGDVSGYDKVVFLDADFLALQNMDHLLAGDWDIRYQPERHHTVCSRSFQAYFTAEERAAYQEAAAAYPITEWQNPEQRLCDWKSDLPISLTGANSGSIAIRAEIFPAVVARWRAIDESPWQTEDGFWDQASCNALLMRHTTKGAGLANNSPQWRAEPFPDGEICFPMYPDVGWHRYRRATLLHNCGGDTLEKIRITFGLYMGTFFGDPTGLFFSILES